ncbi:MAG: NrdH-redoxin [Anaerolineae bacterium]|nr:MAG: NrdH-redoxin [Anaerolineae bacterium]
MAGQNDLYTLTPSQIVLYGVSWCPDCRRARRFLNEHHIPYLDVDIDRDPQGEAFVKKVNNGYRSVPTIVFPDGSVLVEPSTEELAAKLG